MKNTKPQHKILNEAKSNANQQVSPEVVKLANITEKINDNKPGAVKEFSQTMIEEYQIKDERSFMEKLKSYLLIGGVGTVAVGAAGGIGYLLYKGITKGAALAWSLASKGGIYGKLALICAIALPIIYKLLSTMFKKDLSEGSSHAKTVEYKKIAMKKALIESDLMISKMNRVINSEMFTESDAEQTADGVMRKSEGICAKIWGWIKKAISAGYRFVKKYPKITCIILIIICFTIACHKNPFELQQIKNVFNGKISIKQAFSNSAERNEAIAKLKDILMKDPKQVSSKLVQNTAKTFMIDLPSLAKSAAKAAEDAVKAAAGAAMQ